MNSQNFFLDQFLTMCSFVNSPALVIAFCNLLINTALSMAFGERSRLKIGGRY